MILENFVILAIFSILVNFVFAIFSEFWDFREFCDFTEFLEFREFCNFSENKKNPSNWNQKVGFLTEEFSQKNVASTKIRTIFCNSYDIFLESKFCKVTIFPWKLHERNFRKKMSKILVNMKGAGFRNFHEFFILEFG